MPRLKPIIAVALVLRGIDIVTMFTSVFIITGGTPGGTTETMSYFIYRTGFKRFDFGYASAASVCMLVLTVVIAYEVVRRYGVRLEQRQVAATLDDDRPTGPTTEGVSR